MGVFDWLRRGSSTKSATEATQAESAGTAPQETPEESATPAESADQVGIPKQQSADKAADSETGEGARS